MARGKRSKKLVVEYDEYDFEERAAILEYDAGMRRDIAEKVAKDMILRGSTRELFNNKPNKGDYT